MIKLPLIMNLLRGVNAIVYMVDAADSDKIEASRNELHNLLEKPQEPCPYRNFSLFFNRDC